VKIANIAGDLPPQTVEGDAKGDVLVISWGGTYGSVRTACSELRSAGKNVSHMQLRWLSPLPSNVGEIIKGFRRVLVCELNGGQLQWLLRAKFGADIQGFQKVQGKPFSVQEVKAAIERELAVHG